jgi:formamidopyrimidine-DNA glycosylase
LWHAEQRSDESARRSEGIAFRSSKHHAVRGLGRVPELPDVTVYVERLRARYGGARLEDVRVGSPFLVRTVDPPIAAARGSTIVGVSRLGKRIVWELEGELFMVFHLMIAGRFHEKPRGAKVGGRVALAAFDFAERTLLLTEASTKKRASLHLVRGRAVLEALARRGVEVLDVDAATFAAALRRENHTLKRALTDPDIVSGVGNAYSDEILHRARLSPLVLTHRLDDATCEGLWAATREVLVEWTERLRRQVGDGFPEEVTAFRAEMAVHGRYRQPCPVCGTPVQRIAYAENECDYCPTCQNEGRLLADRSLSRLLKDDWPRTVDELEQRRRERVAGSTRS